MSRVSVLMQRDRQDFQCHFDFAEVLASKALKLRRPRDFLVRELPGPRFD